MAQCTATVPEAMERRPCKNKAKPGFLVCYAHLPREVKPRKYYIRIKRKGDYLGHDKYGRPRFKVNTIGRLFDTYNDAWDYLNRYWAHIIRPKEGKGRVVSCSVESMLK